MRHPLAPFIVPFFLLGCIDASGPEGEGLSASSLEPELLDEHGRISWTLQNVEGDVVTVGCQDGFCVDRPFRVEALQADGSWVERAVSLEYSPDRDALRELWPGEETDVAEAYLEEPGTYRAVMRAIGPEGPVDVAREVAIVGWPEETTAQGVALLERADEAGCSAVARRIWSGLLRRAEPDDVEALLARAHDEGRRWSTLRTMMQRGVFVDELADEVSRASMEEVRFFGETLSRYRPGMQEPLRALVAERLLEPLEDRQVAMEPEHIRLLAELAESWPDHAPDALVERLERGPEQDLALAELVDLMVYAPRELFAPRAEEIHAALEERCAGAPEGSELGEACERGLASFSPGFLGFFGRGIGSSCCCGGLLIEYPPVCAEIRAAFDDLVEEAGEPRLRVLGGAVLSAAPAAPR